MTSAGFLKKLASEERCKGNILVEAREFWTEEQKREDNNSKR